MVRDDLQMIVGDALYRMELGCHQGQGTEAGADNRHRAEEPGHGGSSAPGTARSGHSRTCRGGPHGISGAAVTSASLVNIGAGESGRRGLGLREVQHQAKQRFCCIIN